MTQLIDLQAYRDADARTAGAPSRDPSAVPAQILFFTGVRYERMDEPQAAMRRERAGA